MRALLILLCVTSFSRSLFAMEIPFYIGTMTGHSTSQGIYLGSLDRETGKLGPITLAAATKNPNFLALSPDKKFLYAAISTPNGSAVEAYRRNVNGTLALLDERPAGGEDACHVSVDATGHHVFVANYGGGNVAAFQAQPDGRLTERTTLVSFTGSGPNPNRQKKPHAHSIYPDPENHFVYACDLGSDSIWIFKLDAGLGTLTPSDPPAVKVTPGGGPRHLAFSPHGHFVYVANEMGLSVSVFARDAATGQLTLMETVPTLPPGTSTEEVTIAEIAVHPSGKWLYVSNRGCDTLTVFSIATDGRLTFLQSTPSVVKFPRSFAIDPAGHWLIAAGQKDDKIAVFKIDQATGQLSPTDQSANVGTPVCVLFVGK